jgi:hypothetical protein
VHLKKGAHVEVTVEAEAGDTTAARQDQAEELKGHRIVVVRD